MKTVMYAIAVLLLAQPVFAAQFSKAKFQNVVYFAHGGAGNGASASNPKPLVDADVMDLEAGMVVERVYVIVDTPLAGTSALQVGDDDDADGFVPNAALTLGSAGLYGYSAAAAGVYLVQTASGGTDNYNAPAAKYYAAAGKEVKLDVTGASSAGALRLVVEGYKVGAP